MRCSPHPPLCLQLAAFVPPPLFSHCILLRPRIPLTSLPLSPHSLTNLPTSPKPPSLSLSYHKHTSYTLHDQCLCPSGAHEVPRPGPAAHAGSGLFHAAGCVSVFCLMFLCLCFCLFFLGIPWFSLSCFVLFLLFFWFCSSLTLFLLFYLATLFFLFPLSLTSLSLLLFSPFSPLLLFIFSQLYLPSSQPFLSLYYQPTLHTHPANTHSHTQKQTKPKNKQTSKNNKRRQRPPSPAPLPPQHSAKGSTIHIRR